MKRKFWNWIRNEDESVPDMERTLFLNCLLYTSDAADEL